MQTAHCQVTLLDRVSVERTEATHVVEHVTQPLSLQGVYKQLSVQGTFLSN